MSEKSQYKSRKRPTQTFSLAPETRARLQRLAAQRTIDTGVHTSMSALIDALAQEETARKTHTESA